VRLYEELDKATDVAKKLFDFGDFEELREKLLSLYDDDKPTYTDTKIKQVYAQIENGYHLLSVLTPSNILFKIKNRIDDIKFGETSKEAREAKKNNDYHDTGFKIINKLIDISFGGSYPHNVSQLNATNFF
jgi:CRISPR-associated protein Csy1